MKMLRLLFAYFYLSSLFLCVSCGEDEMPAITPPDPVVDVDSVPQTGEEQYLQLSSEYIFDQSKLHTFELTIPPANLAAIDADPAAEQYVEGALTFEGETISPVGIRYKGSIGGFVGCVSGSDWANPSGHKTCTKLSMKVKVNWNGSDTRFYDLRKLQFHSMNLDPSQLRERVGYYLFREMGVPAPRSVHARLVINGELSGLYALTEQIDGRFTRYHFEDGKGNLYKEVWPLTDHGTPHSEQAYLNALKTNEDEDPSVDMIRNFAEAIATAVPSERKEIIQQQMNLNEIIAYVAVDRSIRNDDGAFHWYCGGGGCSPHNFYWYENPSENTLHLIPWDLDNAFENIIFNNNPVTPIADEWGEISNNCNPFSYGLFQFSQRSAACDKLTATWASFTEEYEQALSHLKSGPMSAAHLNGLIDTWAEQIRATTIEASAIHGDAISTGEWNNAVIQLKTQLDHARNN